MGSPSFIQLPPDSTGKQVQTWENTINGQSVYTEAVVPTDTTGTPYSSSNPLPIKVNKSAQNPAVPAASTVGTSSTQVLASNSNRTGLVVTNTSPNIISLAFGSNAAVLNSGITLNPNGGTWVMDAFTFTTDSVNAIASGASSNLAIQELS